MWTHVIKLVSRDYTNNTFNLQDYYLIVIIGS